MSWADHLVLAPVVLPLVAGTLMLLFDGRSRALKAAISLAAVVSLVAAAIMLLRLAEDGGAPVVYRLGDWPAPFGIVFVLDRLSAMMVLLTSVLALAAVVFSVARWHAAGVHFHPLFQFLLMGLGGAFLTGDVFNLFVFFEVLLAASYGLVLHGSGPARVRAGLHYIAVNLLNSSLFLVGASLIYGATGTLNMADLALRIPALPADQRILLDAGAAVLGAAFLLKAGMWPLGFWLTGAYTVAAPPVAAIFAIMSKVGVYVVLRLSLLFFGDGAGHPSALGQDWLFYGGMATILFGILGIMSAQDTARLAAFSLLVSSGTLLAAIGLDDVRVTAGALYYLASSTLTIGALFLLIELVERGRELGADMLAVTREAYGEGDEAEPEQEEEVGFAIPATMAVLGLSFLFCAVLLAGLPPLSGFIAKFALLDGLFRQTGPLGIRTLSGAAWGFVALVILSGLASLIAMTRAGIRSLWATEDREVPRVRFIEMGPVAVLLALTVALTVEAGPAMRFMEDTARSLHDPSGYVGDVLARQQIPSEAQEGGQ